MNNFYCKLKDEQRLSHVTKTIKCKFDFDSNFLKYFIFYLETFFGAPIEILQLITG